MLYDDTPAKSRSERFGAVRCQSILLHRIKSQQNRAEIVSEGSQKLLAEVAGCTNDWDKIDFKVHSTTTIARNTAWWILSKYFSKDNLWSWGVLF